VVIRMAKHRPQKAPLPLILAERLADPDLVDRVFDYLVQMLPELAPRRAEVTDALREEFSGSHVYIRKRGQRHDLVRQVLAMFDGRNATEVARQLDISRPTVYRMLKQSGR
jgi:transcriptional regulator of acetoin/glycerol metabolism